MIKEPTRVTDHSSTCIDLVFANHIDKVIDRNVIKTATSDHYMVYLTRRAQRSRPKTSKRVRMRCLKYYTLQNFLDCLWKHPWEILQDVEDVDDQVNIFNSFFMESVNSVAPFEEKKGKGLKMLKREKKRYPYMQNTNYLETK